MRKTPIERMTGLKPGGKIPKPTSGEKKPRKKLKAKEKCPSVAVLDDLFSRYIRRFGECQLWGYGGVQCSQQLQCSHIHSRTYHSVRWDERNAICACAAHHRWQHNHPTLNTWALEELLGKEHLQGLRDAYLNGKKPTPDEKRAIAKFLREGLREAA